MSLLSSLFGDPFSTPQDAPDWLLAPGTDRRHVALPLMATALRGAGYTVIHGDEREVAADHLRRHGYVVHRNAVQAQIAELGELRRRGFKIFAPHAAPDVGTLWHPTRGKSPDRLVMSCLVAGHVAYRNMADSEVHIVAERTWHGWVSHLRAKVV